jgi:hypothetical protein
MNSLTQEADFSEAGLAYTPRLHGELGGNPASKIRFQGSSLRYKISRKDKQQIRQCEFEYEREKKKKQQIFSIA